MQQHKLEGYILVKVSVTSKETLKEDAEARLAIGLVSAQIKPEIIESLNSLSIDVENINITTEEKEVCDGKFK